MYPDEGTSPEDEVEDPIISIEGKVGVPGVEKEGGDEPEDEGKDGKVTPDPVGGVDPGNSG